MMVYKTKVKTPKEAVSTVPEKTSNRMEDDEEAAQADKTMSDKPVEVEASHTENEKTVGSGVVDGDGKKVKH